MSVQHIIIPFDEEMLPTRKLATSTLNCIYEHGSLRYIRCDVTEVVRMIYFAVRDQDWNTPPYQIENELVTTNERGFSISYTAFHKLNDIEYRTNVIIEAEGDLISFSVKGEALSDFKRNRIGLCVLHPIEGCAGTEAEIITPDGTRYKSVFPVLIAPHQPFKDIRKMEYQTGNSVKATLNFDGDIFETEDQRNWADSSYKTYSTPLDLPLPVEIKKGDTIEQEIRLAIAGSHPLEKNLSANSETKVVFPKIGYGSTHGDELSFEEIDLLRQLPFDHIRVELSLSDSSWKQLLQKKSGEAAKLKTKIELTLFFDGDYTSQLQTFLNESSDLLSSISSILPLQRGYSVTPVNLMKLVYEEIKMSYPHMEIGYGSDGYFADLNRNRPGETSFDFLSFPLCPQVHASDTRSLLENLERQKDLLQTARSFAAGKKIHISPITFKTRSAENDESSADYDVRQHKNVGAMWTLYTLSNLSRSDRLTFYEVKGDRGILNNQPGSQPSAVYKMLQQIKKFNPKWFIEQGEPGFLNGRVMLENEQGERLQFDMISGDEFRS